MKIGVLLGLLALPFVLVIIAQHVDATCTNSALPNANVCKGFSMVGTTTGGTASGRCFSITNAASASLTCTSAGVGATTATLTWQMDAGACQTVRYDDVSNGALPPSVPNKVSLDVRADGGSTVIKTYLTNAAEPASGTTYTFCATSDGNTGSPARMGTYEWYLHCVKDNGPGGVGNYDVDSRGTGSQDTSFNRGAAQGRITVSALGVNSYPTGSTFAYGPSGDETITITGAFTTPNIDNNAETMRTAILDHATLLQGEVGATVDVDSGSLAQNFVADQTYALTYNPWDPILNIQGTSSFTGTNWATMSSTGHGAGITRLSDTTVQYTTSFNVNPNIKMDADGSGGFSGADETDQSYASGTCGTGSLTELFNRGEGPVCTRWRLINARDQLLSRAMTFARHDASHTVCANYGSLTPTSNVYSISGTFSTTATCAGAADATGSPRHISVTNTDQSYESGTVYYISSLYYVDAHLEADATLNKDDFPTENANEVSGLVIQDDGMGNDASETGRGWCHVKGVRKDLEIDTSGSAISWNYKDPTTATRSSGTDDTGSDGWTPNASPHNLLATTPLGMAWTWNCSVSFNGNTGNAAQTFSITIAGGGGVMGFPGDPLRATCTPNLANPSETITCVAAESNADGSARTGNAAGTLYDLWNPSNTQIVSGGSTTEIGSTGVYRFTFSPGASPTLGNYYVVVRTTDAMPVSTQAAFTIETDPTIALANSLASVLTDTGLIKGYTDQVEGFTDTLEASAATAATAHTNLQADTDDLQVSATHADAHHHTIEAYTDGLEPGQTAILDALEAAGEISAAEHQEILDALSSLNMTGETRGNATYALILDKLGPLGEPVNIESDLLDLWMPLLFWIGAVLFLMWMEWVYALAFTVPGILDTLFPDQIPGDFPQWFVFLFLGVLMEFAARRFSWGRYKKNSVGA